MGNVKSMSHIMEGHSFVFLGYYFKELLKFDLVQIKFVNQIKVLEHAEPTTNQSTSIVLEIRHINLKHISEGLTLNLGIIIFDLLRYWFLQILLERLDDLPV